MSKPLSICIVIEAAASLIGVILCALVGLPWWTVLICLAAPPVILIVLGVLFFASATANGSNPFQ